MPEKDLKKPNTEPETDQTAKAAEVKETVIVTDYDSNKPEKNESESKSKTAAEVSETVKVTNEQLKNQEKQAVVMQTGKRLDVTKQEALKDLGTLEHKLNDFSHSIKSYHKEINAFRRSSGHKDINYAEYADMSQMLQELKKYKSNVERMEHKIKRFRKNKDVFERSTLDTFNFEINELEKQLAKMRNYLDVKVYGRQQNVDVEYTTNVYNIKDAKKLKRRNEVQTEYKQKLAKELEPAVKQEEVKQELDNYLNRERSKLNAAKTGDTRIGAYIPTYPAAYAILKANNMKMPEKYLTNGAPETAKAFNAQLTSQVNEANRVYDNYLKTADTGDILKKEGIFAVFDKFLATGSTTKETRETIKSVEKLALVAGIGYAVYELGRRTFFGKSDEKFKGRKVPATLAALFVGTNYMTGTDPVNLIRKTFNGGLDKLNLHPWLKSVVGADSKLNQIPEYRQFVNGPQAVGLLCSGIPASELLVNGLVKTDGVHITGIDYMKFKAYLLNKNDKNKLQILEMLNNDPHNLITEGFSTIGYTHADLIGNPTLSVDQHPKRTTYQDRAKTMTEYRAKNNVKFVSSQAEADYYKNGGDPEKLKTEGKLVPNDSDVGLIEGEKFTKALEGSGLDQAKINEIAIAAQKLQTKIGQPIEVEPYKGKILLKSYGETKTYFDPATGHIGTTEIGQFETPMTSIDEAVKAANFINFMRNKFAGKGLTPRPFRVNLLPSLSFRGGFGRDVEFNNAETWSTSFDTKVVGGGRWSGLNDLSPTLEKNKTKFFETYMNDMGKEFWMRKPGSTGTNEAGKANVTFVPSKMPEKEKPVVETGSTSGTSNKPGESQEAKNTQQELYTKLTRSLQAIRADKDTEALFAGLKLLDLSKVKITPADGNEKQFNVSSHSEAVLIDIEKGELYSKYSKTPIDIHIANDDERADKMLKLALLVNRMTSLEFRGQGKDPRPFEITKTGNIEFAHKDGDLKVMDAGRFRRDLNKQIPEANTFKTQWLKKINDLPIRKTS